MFDMAEGGIADFDVLLRLPDRDALAFPHALNIHKQSSLGWPLCGHGDALSWFHLRQFHKVIFAQPNTLVKRCLLIIFLTMPVGLCIFQECRTQGHSLSFQMQSQERADYHGSLGI